MDLRFRSRITVPLGSTIIPSRGLKYCLWATLFGLRFDLLLFHVSRGLLFESISRPPTCFHFKSLKKPPLLETSFLPPSDVPWTLTHMEQHRRPVPKMSSSLYLELPWQGKRQMFGDIAGFIGVTLVLILIDSYILCEQQNAARIFCSIGIDYAILFAYLAARNAAMASDPAGPATTQYQAPRCQEKQQDYK